VIREKKPANLDFDEKKGTHGEVPLQQFQTITWWQISVPAQ
jgi:hypothetical protein